MPDVHTLILDKADCIKASVETLVIAAGELHEIIESSMEDMTEQTASLTRAAALLTNVCDGNAVAEGESLNVSIAEIQSYL